MRVFKRKKALKITAVILLMAVVAVLAGCYFLSPAKFFKLGDKKGGASAAGQFSSDRLNIVLLGFDGNEKRSKKSTVFRTDTIMIASLDFKNKAVSVASIPRDSYVKIAGTDRYDKINHSYVHGYNAGQGVDKHQNGIETAIKTIEDFLGGIPIHYYVTVDMDGVGEVVDHVGGVYFDVPHAVRTNYGRGQLLLDKGYQLLDGEKFLYFVRDRSVGGDFGRASRQQEIMVEAFRQIKKRGKLRHVPSLYRSLQDNVETNLNPAQIAQLALFGMRVKPEQIVTHVFTGNSKYAASGGMNISYVVIDEKRRVELIKEVFGVEVAERPPPSLPAPVQRPAPAVTPPSGPLPSDTESPGPQLPVEQPGEPAAGEAGVEEEEEPAIPVPVTEEPPSGADDPGHHEAVEGPPTESLPGDIEE